MNRVEVDKNNVCLNRVEEKCINCGMCLKTCKNINGFEKDCINCGQCILTCPTGALTPKYDYQKVLNYLKDTNYTVVVFTAPAVRVAIGDSFGFPPGSFLEGKMVSALRKMGFDYVFDTTFGADLTIMEEANELKKRIEEKNLPMFTSCCPSWVLYAEKYYPKLVSKLSTCKSPIAMQGAMIKSYFSKMYNIPTKKIISVSLTPCISKKYERFLYPETDFVITTSELVLMIRQLDIDFQSLKEDCFDKLLGKGSGGGLIFGTSGGVMESILRTLYYMINKVKAPDLFYQFTDIRGEKDFKETIVDMQKFKLKIAVVNKMATIKKLINKLQEYDFIEVMSCPGGCIGGGGQPLVAIKDLEAIRQERINSMYQDDKNLEIKDSYMNQEIRDAYDYYINKERVELHTNHKKIKNFTNNDEISIIETKEEK